MRTNCVLLYKFPDDVIQKLNGNISQVREVQDRNKPNCFELYATSTDFIKACKTDSEGKVVEGKHTVYRMSAATPEEKEEWIKCIRWAGCSLPSCRDFALLVASASVFKGGGGLLDWTVGMVQVKKKRRIGCQRKVGRLRNLGVMSGSVCDIRLL